MAFIENAPAAAAATLESLILQRESRGVHIANTLRESLDHDTIEAYEIAAQPRLTGAIKNLLNELKQFQQEFREFQATGKPMPSRVALDRLEKLGGLANDVKAHYRKLLASRKLLRSPTSQRPRKLLPLLKKIDAKLRRRCRLHREVLDQYYTQKLMVAVTMMKDYQQRIEQHDQILASQLGTRIKEKTPRPLELEVLLGEDELELWLDAIVDQRLLHQPTATVKRLQQRAEKLFSDLLRHYYKLQLLYSLPHESNAGQQGNRAYTKKASEFLINYFSTRQKHGFSPYWIPEVYRLKQLRELENNMLDSLGNHRQTFGSESWGKD